MKKTEKLKNIGKSCPGVYALVNHSKQKCLEDYYIMCLHERNIGLYNDLGQAKSDKNFFYRASFLDFNVRNLIQNIRL